MKKTILILLTGFVLFTFTSCDNEPDLREPVITSKGDAMVSITTFP